MVPTVRFLLMASFIFLLGGCDSGVEDDTPGEGLPDPSGEGPTGPDEGSPPAASPELADRWEGFAAREGGEPVPSYLHLVAVNDTLYEAAFELWPSEEGETLGEAQYYPQDSSLVVYELGPGGERRPRAELALVFGSPYQLAGTTTGGTSERHVLLAAESEGEGPGAPTLLEVGASGRNVTLYFDQDVHLFMDDVTLFEVSDPATPGGAPQVYDVRVAGNELTIELLDVLSLFVGRTIDVTARGVVGADGVALVETSTSFSYGEAGDADLLAIGDFFYESFEDGHGFFYSDAGTGRYRIYACEGQPLPINWDHCASFFFQRSGLPAPGTYEIGPDGDVDARYRNLYLDGDPIVYSTVNGGGTLEITASEDGQIEGSFDFHGRLWIWGMYIGSGSASGSFRAIRIPHFLQPSSLQRMPPR